jgi:hypothetical protein
VGAKVNAAAPAEVCLGKAVSRNGDTLLVDKHQGEICFETVMNEGTTFVIRRLRAQTFCPAGRP